VDDAYLLGRLFIWLLGELARLWSYHVTSSLLWQGFTLEIESELDRLLRLATLFLFWAAVVVCDLTLISLFDWLVSSGENWVRVLGNALAGTAFVSESGFLQVELCLLLRTELETLPWRLAVVVRLQLLPVLLDSTTLQNWLYVV
jgi:hypothetical protein